MPLASSQFKRLIVADQAGALTDLSQYLRQSQEPKGNAMINATTFQPSGDNVTNNQRKGAIQTIPTVEFLFDPTLVYFLDRIRGKRDGGVWQFFESGGNAAPGDADMAFVATLTVFTYAINYQVGQDGTISPDLGVSDGSTTVPGWYPV